MKFQTKAIKFLECQEKKMKFQTKEIKFQTKAIKFLECQEKNEISNKRN